MAENILKQR